MRLSSTARSMPLLVLLVHRNDVWRHLPQILLVLLRRLEAKLFLGAV